MKKILLIFALAFLASCSTEENDPVTPTECQEIVTGYSKECTPECVYTIEVSNRAGEILFEKEVQKSTYEYYYNIWVSDEVENICWEGDK